MLLQNKIAIITGASRGIGKAIAQKLASGGAQVILLARNQSELEQTVTQLRESGRLAAAFVLDVRDESRVKAVFSQIADEFGRIDILVNNAGIGDFKPVAETDASKWDELMAVNLKATFLCSQAVLLPMKKQGSGHIVTIASDVAKRTFAGGALHCASKHAQDAFSSALRKEVRKEGIKVSVIYPGLVDTYFHDGHPGKPENSGYLKPEDIAEAVHYVISAPAHVVVDELMIHPLSQEY